MVIVVIKAELMGALIEVLIKGRIECYVKKSSAYNPYSPGQIYDWDFKLSWGDYLFSDSYRGFNPYSGVEYIYYKERSEPIWSCDYVGYALAGAGVSEKEIYGFLKQGRGKHLLEWAGECTGTPIRREILVIKPGSAAPRKVCCRPRKFTAGAD